MPRGRLIASVLLPFAAGYFLSYVFRTVNAVIAADLATELNLGAADLGFLTSVYFLVFAAVQLPLGVLLDRVGPALVQSILMLFASTGALVFALADGFLGLMIGRVLLGIGVATALMAGVKAIALWFPPSRSASAAGWLVMLGALGALTATAPADLLVQAIGWRGLFVVLAGLSALASLLVLFAAPHPVANKTTILPAATFAAIYADARFWRIAPLSALGIGTSWSLQGLWAAPWLRDVDGFDRAAIVRHLGFMAIAVCAGALLLGTAADRLRKAGVKTEIVLAATLSTSALAQAALILQWPLPPLLPFIVIAAAGAATVLSFAIMGEYFPKAMAGRANGALNLLHVGSAFAIQSATGILIAQWPQTHGGYPAHAHRTAMAIVLALQVSALAWFSLAHHVRRDPKTAAHRPLIHSRRRVIPTGGHGWRTAALASSFVCLTLATILFSTLAQRSHADDPRLGPWLTMVMATTRAHAYVRAPQ
ncbi:MAG: MFS transporter [Hyphomicrobiales bacterium]|nr:MAG: MFS transporter [Hyphomicrobiales bacterium]